MDRPVPLSRVRSQVLQAPDTEDVWDRLSQEVTALYGLRQTRHPRVIILIGRSSDLNVVEKQILTELNLSLNRVEVVPYDLFGRRIEAVIRNVEEHLAGNR